MDQYRIWVTFENDHRTLDTDWCDVITLQSSLRRLLHGPISLLRVIKEIRVVDMGDCIVYLVQEGQQVFPPLEEEASISAAAQ